MNCDDTREILISEHYYNFERKLKYKLADLYSNFNFSFRDENLFGKDWDNELGEIYSKYIYNYISINYDINLFYDCPALAIELLSKKTNKLSRIYIMNKNDFAIYKKDGDILSMGFKFENLLKITGLPAMIGGGKGKFHKINMVFLLD